MYADPKLIKDDPFSVRLDAYRRAELQRLVNATGGQRAAIVRRWIEERLDQEMERFHATQSAGARQQLRGSHQIPA